MDLEKEKFRKLFPKLAEEMTRKTCVTEINSVRSDPNTAENAISNRFSGYSPDVIDFLRRCDKTEQAEEIICYLEKRKEISSIQAKKLRNQLKTKGIRSFGAKKDDGYYLKQDGF
ncbi:MAG: DUF2095 family protein [Candidatus Bathyarchaeota archaeon]|jgi:hypothetical protein